MLDPLLRRLARNIRLNLAGNAIPLVAAFFTIPVLIFRLGPDRFGVLALAWVVIGYFGLFDFGLGRAVTRLIAVNEDKTDSKAVGEILATSISLLTIFGGLAFIAIWFLGSIFANHISYLPPALRAEVDQSFSILAFAVPFVLLSSALRGVLEGFQRFGLANAIRIPLSVLMYVGPLITTLYGPELPPIALVLLSIRLVGFLAHVLVVAKVAKMSIHDLRFNKAIARQALFFGSWLTVSNIIGPLLTYADRFAIGLLLSASAVAYYVTPYEIAGRLNFIGSAVSGVLFAAFSEQTRDNVKFLSAGFLAGISRLVLILFPILLILGFLSHPFLTIWINKELADKSYLVLQLIAFGVWINALAQVPYALIQAYGRSDLTAKIHLAETPFYFILLWLLIHEVGIAGAAIAWSLRTTADLFLLVVVVNKSGAKGNVPVRKIVEVTFITASAMAVVFSIGNLVFVQT